MSKNQVIRKQFLKICVAFRPIRRWVFLILIQYRLITSGNIVPYVGGLRTATIGKWDVAFQSQEHFDGLMDEYMVYDRALSSNEIEQLYNVPEPITLLLIGFGGLGLRFKRK